jgi:hypothetical protein
LGAKAARSEGPALAHKLHHHKIERIVPIIDGAGSAKLAVKEVPVPYIKTLAAVLLGLTLIIPVMAQNPSSEALAQKRVLRAGEPPSFTINQCLADLSSWNAKDDTDNKAKVEHPNYWYEKLSTEELIRLATECFVCFGTFQRALRRDDVVFVMLHERLFNIELRWRATNVLRDHGLFHEWLLKGAK